jgi:hypothetical protein
MIELESYMCPVPTFRRGSTTQVQVNRRTVTPHRSKLESIEGRRRASKKHGPLLISLLEYLRSLLSSDAERRSKTTFGEYH